MGLLGRLLGRPPSPDEFAKAVCRRFRQAGAELDPAYDREQFSIVVEQPDHVVNLANFYAEHRTLDRSARKEHIDTIVRAILSARLEPPEEWEDAKPDIRPKVWSRAGLDLPRLKSRLKGGPGDVGGPLMPLGEHLYLGLVYDLPRAMQSIPDERLESWGITIYEALEAAKHELEQIPFALMGTGEGFYIFNTGDHYDSSRLILVEQFERLDLKGRPVVLVGNRDSLFLTGSEDSEGLRLLVELGETALTEEPRPLSPFPLIFEDGHWEDWDFPVGHPSYSRLRELQTGYLASTYNDQLPLLQELYEQRGEDVFFANYIALKAKESGESIELALWSKGVDSILPQAEYLLLKDKADAPPLAAARFDSVRAEVGNLMELVEDLYPPRYRVRDFPDEAQLKQLGVDSRLAGF
ncbi:hypothetical protein [Stratiformator vulcanicus]|uniref:Uncharacterized protein n=1 Tax=Stratiformator vulcanicus TaxID=2527980 RepID=A0A517R0J3_9PLAN|nr:hypothetical protein [Stratiformator vulcanicus]QDT37353.1 hypothetical protein Pan189_17260 [Stratiformator vulcanicus]